MSKDNVQAYSRIERDGDFWTRYDKPNTKKAVDSYYEISKKYNLNFAGTTGTTTTTTGTGDGTTGPATTTGPDLSQI